MKNFADNTVSTKYWHGLDDGRVQCDLCPRFCKLKEGQRGLCFVRANQQNQIVLTSYGLSSGFCIDPVEKKPLNHFLPGTPVLSFGTAGCNLNCKFCQNWDISKSREMVKLASKASPATIAKQAKRNNCRSVAFTYNDPVIFHEYAIDAAEACNDSGLKSIAVSAGYINEEPRFEFFDAMDAANIDLKAFTDKFYYRLTGAHLQPVLETLCYLRHETKVWFEITTLLIPGENDSDTELHQMCEWLMDNLGADIPLHFSAFHPDWKMRDVLQTPVATLIRAREIAMKTGLRYVYTGNAHDVIGGSTRCYYCSHLLIERDWYELGKWGVGAGGCCESCGATLPGVFEASPGDWGARRLAIFVSDKLA